MNSRMIRIIHLNCCEVLKALKKPSEWTLSGSVMGRLCYVLTVLRRENLKSPQKNLSRLVFGHMYFC